MKNALGKVVAGSKYLKAIGSIVAIFVLTVPVSSAQPGSNGRLNKIIEQFEKGEPALVGEHWQLNDLEHNALQQNEFE